MTEQTIGVIATGHIAVGLVQGHDLVAPLADLSPRPKRTTWRDDS